MRKKAILFVLFLSALISGVASATDNNSAQHWHDYDLITWDYNTWSSDESWEFQVEFAFDTWETFTVVDFTKVTSSSDIEVSRGPAEDGDCGSQVIACARWYPNPLTAHNFDANIWFNTDNEYDWDSGICNPDWDEYSRYSVAMHEIGHASGSLIHSSDSDAIMYATFATGDCKNLTTHDEESMDAQYDDH